MAYGTINVDTLTASTGVLATQNGMTGIAKAWVQFAGATGTIASSFNVSSVTRNSTGNYTINFTTAMANANYSLAGMAQFGTSGGPQAMIAIVPVATPLTTTGANIAGVRTDTGTYVDFQTMCCSIFAS